METSVSYLKNRAKFAQFQHGGKPAKRPVVVKKKFAGRYKFKSLKTRHPLFEAHETLL